MHFIFILVVIFVVFTIECIYICSVNIVKMRGVVIATILYYLLIAVPLMFSHYVYFDGKLCEGPVYVHDNQPNKTLPMMPQRFYDI